MTNRLFMGAVDVIVLVAGRSSRLGQPKALVDVDGRPLVAHLIQRLQRINNVEITKGHNNPRAVPGAQMGELQKSSWGSSRGYS